MIAIAMPLALLFQTPGTTAQTAAPPAPACDTAAHTAFDFWVGEWDVYPAGQDTQVAKSLIERRYKGCAVVEQWMPFRGEGGTSLNHVDPESGRWHQKWVGQSPGAVEFVGGPAEGKMVLQGYWEDLGGPGVDALVRMTYTAQEDGSVRQHGEASTDHGLSWATSFDFIYRPAAD
ncbi:hypothetical protein ACFCW2_11570 [Qipengyuania sp. DSG2-2]|uniref:hypothetical protein n=1 Tax=Qipengyuania sp. DGS2-2 TaxID=3349631 RepID=UPI0036D2B04A